MFSLACDAQGADFGYSMRPLQIAKNIGWRNLSGFRLSKRGEPDDAIDIVPVSIEVIDFGD